MLGNTFKQKIKPREYDIFSGLDVDKRSIDTTFGDHEHWMRSMKIPHSSAHLINYVRKHFPNQKVAFAYEAGGTGYKLYDDLTAAGFTCLVLAPSMIPTAPGKHIKTNRIDSKKISSLLRGGGLEGIYVPSPTYRSFRHLTQLRDVFVKQVIAFKCRVKALLLLEGIPFPSGPAGQWSYRVVNDLRALTCPPVIRFKLDHLLSTLEFHQQRVKTVTKEIYQFSQADPEITRCIRFLRSIPGIGQIVASSYLARIGDWRHIHNVRQPSGLLGLVPSEDSTGDDVNRGSITRSGDKHVRNKLIQAAWRAISKDPELEALYKSVYRKHPKAIASRKAIVAVANSLCRRMACVLKQQRPYVVRRVKQPVTSKKEETAVLQGTTRLTREPRTMCVP